MFFAWDLPNSGQLLSRHHGPQSFFSVPDLLLRASMLLSAPDSDDIRRPICSSGTAIEVVQVPGFPIECVEIVATLSLANCDSAIENPLWINVHAITGIGPD